MYTASNFIILIDSTGIFTFNIRHHHYHHYSHRGLLLLSVVVVSIGFVLLQVRQDGQPCPGSTQQILLIKVSALQDGRSSHGLWPRACLFLFINFVVDPLTL